MKKLALISAGAASLAIAGVLLVPNLVNAQGGQGNSNGSVSGYGYERALTTKAEALNMTKDELQTQLQDKTMDQIMEEQGVSEEQFHQAMGVAAEARWKERGLTTEQIAERQAARAENQANHEDGECDGTMNGGQGVRYGQSR
jgi:hypothetical protein